MGQHDLACVGVCVCGWVKACVGMTCHPSTPSSDTYSTQRMIRHARVPSTHTSRYLSVLQGEEEGPWGPRAGLVVWVGGLRTHPRRASLC